jgi:uncharacterized FlaG/YvyC family protein
MEITPVERNAHQLPALTPSPVEPTAMEKREVIQAVKAVNGSDMLSEGNELVFQRDRDTQRIVIRLVNRKTGDVVTQVPPEYVLRLAESMRAER